MDEPLPAEQRRASHADREHVAERLRDAAGDGRLTMEELESRRVVIRAFALMGGIDIVVPDDCAMEASGLGLMGGFDHYDKAGPPPTGAPVVIVKGLALMGGVTVVRRPRRSAGALGAGEFRELDR